MNLLLQCSRDCDNSKIATIGNIYDKLEQVYDTTGGLCNVDLAFRVKSYLFLIRSEKPTVDMTIQDRDIAKSDINAPVSQIGYTSFSSFISYHQRSHII